MISDFKVYIIIVENWTSQRYSNWKYSKPVVYLLYDFKFRTLGYMAIISLVSDVFELWYSNDWLVTMEGI